MKNTSYFKKLFWQVPALLALISPSFSSYAIDRCRLRLSPFNFGVYYPMQSNHLDITGSIDVRCRGRRGSFEIGASTGASNSFVARSLSFRGDVLSYNLFTDASRSTVWTDVSSQNVLVGFYRGGRRGRLRMNFYGRAFANQDPRPGRYRDMVTITVQF